jgi:chloramphenicol 3-O phosphotransferase
VIARIIILNGVGSVGKSSIARALQKITAQPFLHVAMDAFLDMLPASYMDHPDGFLFEDHGKKPSPP